jgi:hypothetical protein
MSKDRITFELDNTIQVFRYGHTSNEKISNGKKLVQSYTFSLDQFLYVKDCINSGSKVGMHNFFDLDSQNCFDCPFSRNSGDGNCYTHKFNQYVGFISMIKSIIKEFDGVNNIPEFSESIGQEIVAMSTDKYIRFGTYGEPTLHPFLLVETMCQNTNVWTGYTHQYVRNLEFGKYFMASTHTGKQAETAKTKFNYRSFVALKANNGESGVICPASKESGYVSNCANCGLCSGTMGKGNKDVLILQH